MRSSSSTTTRDLNTSWALIDISVLMSTSLARTISAFSRLINDYSFLSTRSRTSISRFISACKQFIFFFNLFIILTRSSRLVINVSLASASSCSFPFDNLLIAFFRSLISSSNYFCLCLSAKFSTTWFWLTPCSNSNSIFYWLTTASSSLIPSFWFRNTSGGGYSRSWLSVGGGVCSIKPREPLVMLGPFVLLVFAGKHSEKSAPPFARRYLIDLGRGIPMHL